MAAFRPLSEASVCSGFLAVIQTVEVAGIMTSHCFFGCCYYCCYRRKQEVIFTKCQVLYIMHLIPLSQQSVIEGGIIKPILQVGKLRLREGTNL